MNRDLGVWTHEDCARVLIGVAEAEKLAAQGEAAR
jgi:hypothetical protein